MDENRRTFEFAARFASEKGIARYTRFLDPVQVAAAKQIAREHGAAFSVWGGYEQAERQIGCFLPWGEEASSSDFPLVCLHSHFSSKFCSLSHRDLLGAYAQTEEPLSGRSLRGLWNPGRGVKGDSYQRFAVNVKRGALGCRNDDRHPVLFGSRTGCRGRSEYRDHDHEPA